MKIRKILLIPILFIIILSGLSSCGVDRWPEYAAQTALDEWIDSVMRQEYLWYEEMPASKSLNFFITPDKFLQSVIYKARDNNYSYVDTLLETPLPSYGFDYTLYRNVKIDTLYNALITYVLPDSPASDAGLKRGEWIVKVGDKYITKKNEVQLLQSGGALNLTLGKYEMQKDKEDKDIGVVVETGTAQMEAERSVEDNPIPYWEVINTTTNAKVGYLVYSHFTAGTHRDKEKYNNKLREISREFANAGVTYFILDLRYNTGGSLECAQLLSTLLAPEEALGTLFANLEYNDKQMEKDHELLFDPQLIGTGANMNIQHGFILSTSSTSGMSGTMLNCLYPFNRWSIVGTSIPCAGVATESFINPQYAWSINPVVCYVYNSKGESGNGGSFTAGHTANETTDLTKFLPFGNKEEALLNIAIGVIDGTYPPKEEEKPKSSLIPVKNVYHSQNYRTKGGIRLK